VEAETSIEWYKPQKGKDYVADDEGYEVPQVFREFRH
jgi:hypothetical protein